MPTLVEGRTQSVENIVVVEASGQANIAAVGSRTEWVCRRVEPAAVEIKPNPFRHTAHKSFLGRPVKNNSVEGVAG